MVSTGMGICVFGYPHCLDGNVVDDDAIRDKVQQNLVFAHPWGANDHIIAIKVHYIHVRSCSDVGDSNQDVSPVFYDRPASYSFQLQEVISKTAYS